MPTLHEITRLHLVLNTDNINADKVISRSRRLFHHQLQAQLATILSQLSVMGRKQQAGRITIDLGDIPETFFETEFCRRLAWKLPAELRQQLRYVTATDEHQHNSRSINSLYNKREGQGAEKKSLSDESKLTNITDRKEEENKDSASTDLGLLTSYLRSAVWSQDMPPDMWLMHLLSMPDTSLTWLVNMCLKMPKIGLPGRYFRGETLGQLTRRLAPGIFENRPVSPGTVLLAVLHWYQNHPEVNVPALPAVDGWPVLSLPEGMVESSRSVLTRPALLPWCKVLEQNMSRAMGDVSSIPVNHPVRSRGQLPSGHHNACDTFLSTAARHPIRGHAPLSSRHHDARDKPVSTNMAPGYQQVCHAGLSLLWPLLPELLQVTGIRQQETQMDEHQRREAVKLLAYLAQGEVSENIPCTSFGHWLCGVSAELTQEIEPLSAVLTNTIDGWLHNLPERIPGWQRLSGLDIRQLFLQREGWLCPDSNTLYLPPQPADVLLAQWPWPLTILLLPWLKSPLTLSQSLPPQ